MPGRLLFSAIGQQLRCPRGPAGRVVGLLMRVVNVRPNALAVAALRLQPGDEVLELGCGPGHAVSMMVARVRGGAIHAVDPSPTMLAQARKRNRGAIRTGRVRLYRAQAEQLPFADGSMDKVLAVNVAYFWRDPAAALGEIRRVLRSTGILSIYVTDASTMRQWAFAGADTHRLFGREELARWLHEAALDDDCTITAVRITARITGFVVAATTSPSPDVPA